MRTFDVTAIGKVESRLTDRASAPRKEVILIAINGRQVVVRHLEALNGTPILDVKPLLSGDITQR